MDRWVEVDIDWFGDPPWQDPIDRFVERILPLLAGERELRGVCLNVGWLADIVTEWTGRAEQKLPLRSRRFARWAALSYADLRRFLAELRAALAREGLSDSRLGVLVAGVGEVVWPPEAGTMYDLSSSWHERHPELYRLHTSPLPGPDLDPRVPLRADDYPYATRPDGLQAGQPFPEFLGEQWGAAARFLGLDLVHFRDGFFGPLLYTRVGPYGTAASPDPDENQTWTAAVARLFRASKDAHPDGLVMAYSSGLSGTAEWTVGCVDLEAVVADGALDIFIDQTWGGAWQDWWDDLWKGWTFQQAYLLGHGAQIAGGNATRATAARAACRRYDLIETWDGWEPWDTLHDVPGKLEWACWAFLHAAVIGPDGVPRPPDGSYISWMNDWNGRLIAEADVAWLAARLGAAERSAERLENVYGPLLVHDRRSLEAKMTTRPAENASEWIEDHVGMAMKWGAPVTAATRAEWLPERWPDGAFVQLGSGCAEGLGAGRVPAVVSGRADLIDGRLLARGGLRAGDDDVGAGYRLGYPTSPDLPHEERIHLPVHRRVEAGEGTWVGYRSDRQPLLAGRDGVVHWQPPDLANPANALVPRSQIGSPSPYIEAYRALAAATDEGVRVEPVAVHEPVAVSVWRSGGAVHVLLGNLESRWFGDARFPRRATVVLPRRRVGLAAGTRYVLRPLDGDGAPVVSEPPDGPELRFTVEVGPEACVVARVEPATEGLS